MNAEHTLICGDSGGGKTTLMREMHATFDGVSIWINHNGERVPDGRGFGHATTVDTFGQLQEAAASRDRAAINYRTNNALEAVQQARSIAYHVVDGPVQIVIDEAHDYLPDGKVDKDNPLKQSLHEDRSAGVRVVLATQDPSDFDYTPIKQCSYIVWCGPWSVFHDGFIRYFSVPRENLPTEPYRYVVLNKRMEIEYQGETQERYG